MDTLYVGLHVAELFSFNKLPFFTAFFTFLRLAAPLFGKTTFTFPGCHDITTFHLLIVVLNSQSGKGEGRSVARARFIHV